MKPGHLACGLALLASVLSAQTVPQTAVPAASPAAPAAARPSLVAPQPGAQAAQPVRQPAQESQQPAQAARKPAPPVPPDDVLFRPMFLTADIAHYAGLAFRLKQGSPAQHYLVTAHSSFGPAADLAEQMSSEEISRVVVAAVGVSCTDRSHLVLARPYLLIPDARSVDDRGAEKDMALFRITSKGDEPALELDPAPPIKGDRVWIYVKYEGTAEVGLEGATIAYVSPVEVRYYLDNQNADLSNTRGAPVLSPDGTVVGIHLDVFKSKSGLAFGFACPASAVRDEMGRVGITKRAPKVLR